MFEDEDSQSPDNLNNTVLAMDDTENNDETPSSIKTYSTFGKYGENFSLYNSAYKRCQNMFKLESLTLNKTHTLRGTIVPSLQECRI